MPVTFAVSVSPTWAVPLMAGALVASLFGLAATSPVGSLGNDSVLPESSVKLTVTLTVLPSSSSVRV